MIYTVISTINENRIKAENRDCRVLRQPLSLLPAEISDYINKAKNDSVRAERCLAYTTLLCALKTFYGLDGVKIYRSQEGKPCLADSDVHINLSHSDGTVAVCISDEGEIGIDLQSEISPEREKRLGDRYFTDLSVKNENIGVKYFFCTLSDGVAELTEIECPSYTESSFTAKWAYAESLMKLRGGGFGDIGRLPALAENSKTEIREISFDKKYVIAVSAEK